MKDQAKERAAVREAAERLQGVDDTIDGFIYSLVNCKDREGDARWRDVGFRQTFENLGTERRRAREHLEDCERHLARTGRGVDIDFEGYHVLPALKEFGVEDEAND